MIPPELLNNLAVLMLQEQRSEEALSILSEALQNADRLLDEGDKADLRL